MPAKVKRRKPPKVKRSDDTDYNALLDDSFFVVLDIETSGFSPEKGAEIIELAAVKIMNGRIIDSIDWLIKPQRPISKRITDITNITNDMLKDGENINDVLESFLEFAGGSTLVAHNDTFERRFLDYYLKKLGIHLENDWVCTMKLFNTLYPERVRLSLGSKLEDLTAYYNVQLDAKEQHRALPDTLATAKAFLKMRKEVLGSTYINKELSASTQTKLPEVKKDDSIQSFVFTSVRYWEKCYNHKRDDWARRLYIHFYSDDNVLGTVYYDLYSKSYQVQSVVNKYTRKDVPIDMDAFEKALLKHLSSNSIREYLIRQGIFKKVQRQFMNRIVDKGEFLEREFPESLVKHIEHVKGDIPYDKFSLKGTEDKTIYVTNEKRGSKYRYHYAVADIK